MLTKCYVFPHPKSVRAWHFLTRLVSCWPRLVCLHGHSLYVLDVSLMVDPMLTDAFAGCTCLILFSLSWSQADQVLCVCAFAECMCLTLSLLGWSLMEYFVSVPSQGVRTWCFPHWAQADRVLCVCMFAVRTCLMFSLLVDHMLMDFRVFARW